MKLKQNYLTKKFKKPSIKRGEIFPLLFFPQNNMISLGEKLSALCPVWEKLPFLL